MLPGFRDVRTPLITGFLWLSFLWILLGTPVPTGAETEGLLGALNALAKFLSPTVTVVVLSFIAYLLGVLASPDADRFLRPGRGLVGRLESLGFDLAASPLKVILSPRMLRRLSTRPGTFSPALTQHSEGVLRSLVVNLVDEKRSGLEPIYKKYGLSRSDAQEQNEELVAILHQKLVNEILDPSAALLAADEKLFNNFDRTRSEAEFRFSITFPVLFVSAAAAWRIAESYWFLAIALLTFGVLACAGLVFKGWIKLHESTDIAVAAVAAGSMQSRTLRQLDVLVTSTSRPRKWWHAFVKAD